MGADVDAVHGELCELRNDLRSLIAATGGDGDADCDRLASRTRSSSPGRGQGGPLRASNGEALRHWQRMMDTPLDPTQRLRAAGYDIDFSAVAGGRLRCVGYGLHHDPAGMSIEEIVCFEGASDPSDESILLALRLPCGREGLSAAAYGADTPAADVKVLHRLPPM